MLRMTHAPLVAMVGRLLPRQAQEPLQHTRDRTTWTQLSLWAKNEDRQQSYVRGRVPAHPRTNGQSTCEAVAAAAAATSPPASHTHTRALAPSLRGDLLVAARGGRALGRQLAQDVQHARSGQQLHEHVVQHVEQRVLQHVDLQVGTVEGGQRDQQRPGEGGEGERGSWGRSSCGALVGRVQQGACLLAVSSKRRAH